MHGTHVKIDGKFGPATEAAVRLFQSSRRRPATGRVDEATFRRLTAPMATALRPIASEGRPPGQLVVAYARQHLAQHPREIGGQNHGPWVRLYMKGKEGEAWPWCAGFVCFCLKQACDTLGVTMPITASFSCDSLAASAKDHAQFLNESEATERSQITVGSLFLNRRMAGDWTHTGIVVRTSKEFFHTIEGNTNDDGSREGYEVCARIRGYGNTDFVQI